MSLNFIRSIVSGRRNRYTLEGYNLDLTYITSRIIAAAYPASGIEATFKNKICDVSKFLRMKHPGSYRVYNLSGRKYCSEFFEGQVEDYTCWGDHHSPPMHALIEVVNSVFMFLSKNKSNVVMLHCNAGKGRTGTAISCALMYCGMIDAAKEALRFYSCQRFENGLGGVTQPCQLRYVYYFEQLLQKKVLSASPKVFRQMIIKNIPSLFNELKLGVEIYQYHYKNLIYSTFASDNKHCIKKGDTDCFVYETKICPNISIVLCDDIYIKVLLKGKLKDSLLCRFCFNTAFIGKENKLKFKKKELDPDSFQRNKKIPEAFELIIYFSDTCIKCSNQTPIEEYCHNCMTLSTKSVSNWVKISVTLNNHVIPKPENYIGGDMTDMEKIKKLLAEESKIDTEFEYSDDEGSSQQEEAKEIKVASLVEEIKASTGVNVNEVRKTSSLPAKMPPEEKTQPVEKIPTESPFEFQK